MFLPTWRGAFIKVVPSARTHLFSKRTHIFRSAKRATIRGSLPLQHAFPFSYDCKWICSTPVLLRKERRGGGDRSAAIAINKKLIDLGKKHQWKDLLKLVAKEEKNFNNVNYATVMIQLGRLPSFDKSDPRFLNFLNSLSQKIQQRGLPWIQNREVANIIYAIGKIRLSCESANDIMAWVSKSETAKEFVKQANTRDLANTAWAFATLGVPAPKLFAEIDAKSYWLVKNGNPQEVANTAWAFATLGIEATKLFTEIEDHSDWLVKNGNPQAVANTAWAFATLDIEAPKLFAAVDAHSDWLVKNDTTQEIANTAWAFATLGIEATKLFTEIEDHSDWLVKNGNPQAVANTAWAFATLDIEAPKLFAAVDAHSDWLVKNGTTQTVANTAWAFATLRIKAPNLFAIIDAHSSWLIKNGNPQAIANTAWAFATLGIEAPKLFAELNSNAKHVILKDWNPQNVSNLCYAIFVSGCIKDCKALLLVLWGKAIELFFAKSKFVHEDFFRQLGCVDVFAMVSGVQLSQLPKEMSKEIEKAMVTEISTGSSRSERKVSKILTEIGFVHECSVSPDSNILGDMLAIDYACTKQKVAIEYDGESHFLKDVGTGMLTTTWNGSTKAKRRLLEQLGWTVINLDYRDYMEACNKCNEKQWLRKQLKDAGVSLLYY